MGASFVMRGRNTIRSDITEGCCFTSLFMYATSTALVHSLRRAEPRFTFHRPGQPLYPQNGPVSLPPLCDEPLRSQRSGKVSSLACPPVSDTLIPG